MKISFILPTYNNEQTVEDLLKSIFMQDFPREEFEVLFLDGGSIDRTLEIAKKYPVKIINNPKKVEENAYIMGIEMAKGDILAFTDADNVLIGKDWIKKMLEPFEDKEIVFADQMYYSYRPNDKMSVKYQGLIGGDDPFATYLGLYSRWCYFTNNWTSYPYEKEKKKNYWKCKLKDGEKIPSFSTNGLLIRKNVLNKMKLRPFTEIDIFYRLINSGHNCFAKVDAGLVHNQVSFFGKKMRRVSRRHKKEIETEYHYGITKMKTIIAALWVITVIPVFVDMMIGFIRKPTLAWLFHPIACFGEFGIYFFYSFLYKHILLGEEKGF